MLEKETPQRKVGEKNKIGLSPSSYSYNYSIIISYGLLYIIITYILEC